MPTDSPGSAAHGLPLFRARAEAVLKVLNEDPNLAQLRTRRGQTGRRQRHADRTGRVEIVITRS
ncbi:hypothetical protein ABZ599_32770 [Streptomyces misionensis]|uniref:hypothetical protein n=1 Tax=Streptomyces misionensis TaxID=67331 RepID=UPI0033D09E9F